MRWTKLLVSLALLASPFAQADPSETQSKTVSKVDDSSGFGVSAGAGLANELLGFQIHARHHHLGLFGSKGLVGFGGGVRYFLWSNGQGPFLSAHVAWCPPSNRPGCTDDFTYFWIAATVNYRFRHDIVFLEVGLGPAAVLARAYLDPDRPDGRRMLVKRWNWGIIGDISNTPFIPDFHLAVGFEF